MLYSIKKETGHETPKDKSTNKYPHPDMNQPPPPIPSPHHL